MKSKALTSTRLDCTTFDNNQAAIAALNNSKDSATTHTSTCPTAPGRCHHGMQLAASHVFMARQGAGLSTCRTWLIYSGIAHMHPVPGTQRLQCTGA